MEFNELELLLSLGFSWRSIGEATATPSRVAYQEYRKYRATDSCAADADKASALPFHERVSELAKLCSTLQNEFHIVDVVAWLEKRIHVNSSISCLELLGKHRNDLVLLLAANRISGTDALERFDPNWKQRELVPFEVFTANDGQPGVRFS